MASSSTTSPGSLRHPKRVMQFAYAAFITILLASITLVHYGNDHLPTLPRLKVQYKNESPYDPRKVALLIENRPMSHLVPLLLHFTSVIPPDWRVQFMGSPESVELVNSYVSVQHQVDIGKMYLTYIPENMTTVGGEAISQFLTTLWIYETLLQPAEWLLVFQTDSMMCANSGRGLNEWLDYDWVGAPWNEHDRYGGNGGLSLRRVSAIIEVLRNQNRRENEAPEDLWFSGLLGQRVGAKVANGTLELEFSGENVHSVKPMGYHTGGSGSSLGGANWGTPERRRELYEYCPEVKMMLGMDAEKYIPGDCNQEWKRDERDPYYVPHNLVAW